MSRNIDFRTNVFQPYSQSLGELALIWNDFHMTLATLFWTVSKIPNGLTPNAIWNSLKSDRAQRDILESIVDLRVIGHNLADDLRSEIKWVLSETNKLEDLRNNALHSPFLNSDDGTVFAWHQLGNKRAINLAKKSNLLKELRWFYDATLILREYTELLSETIRYPTQPIPQRPSLPNRGDLATRQNVIF
jgi:hypothetical protein